MNIELTRAAVLSPPGVAAIATLAVVGPDAWTIGRARFRRATGQALPTEPDSNRHWNGTFGPPPGDEVVLAVRRGMPTPWIEIHCHGGEHAVRWLLDDLRSHGTAICTAADLLELWEPSPLRTAASCELLRAATSRTAAILLDQYHGALDAALAEIEADLAANDVTSAKRRLNDLRRFAAVGQHLVQPWSVAVAGTANVGKSSLVNRIVGYSRCVVTPTPGTTRDAVSTVIAVDGWPVELIDTAGLRSTTDSLERSGIDLAQSTARTADLTLRVIDATRPATDRPEGALIVWNKMDLVGEATVPPGALPTSAVTGAGIDQLLKAISERLVPHAPPTETAIPFTGDIAGRIDVIVKLTADAAVSHAVAAIRDLKSNGG